jgi:hypothetical protein
MMPTRHWSRRFPAPVAGAVVVLLAAGTAPAARADDAALATWLRTAFDPVQTLHAAENAVIPILSPIYLDEEETTEKPLDDVTVLKEPCDRLHDAQVALDAVMTTPDPTLTAEIHQAVDSIDTAVANCTQVIADEITDRRQARGAIQRPLRVAEDHLATADALLAKLAKP